MQKKYFKVKDSLAMKMKLSILFITFVIFCCFSFLFYTHYVQRNNITILSNAYVILKINSRAIEEIDYLENVDDTTTYDFSYKTRTLNNVTQYMSAIEKIEHADKISSLTKEVKNLLRDYFDGAIDKSFLIANIRKNLRKIQLTYVNDNEDTYENIISNQYSPLLLTGLIICLFLTWAILWIWKITREIKHSLYNILSATTNLKDNFFDFNIPVLNHDELGLITFEINDMVEKLRNNRESLINSNLITGRLLNISGLFSKALTEDEIYDALFNYTLLQIGQGVVSVYYLNNEKTHLELIKSSGDYNNSLANFQLINLSENYPICESVKKSKPLFISNYMFLDSHNQTILMRKQICLPLLIEARVLGVLSLNYPNSQKISEIEEEFLISLANYCSEAIYRTKLYDSAKKAITIRDEFIAIASHALQTPLTPIKIQLQNLKRKLDSFEINDEQKQKTLKSLNVSLHQVDKLSTIVNDLLNVTNINIKKIIVNKQWINLDEFVKNVLIHFSKNNVAIVPVSLFNNVPPDTFVYWDTDKIEEIFLNIFSNAAKYAPDKVITINIHEKENFIYTRFRDYGPGINNLYKDKIFEKYERIININNISGLGLGLYISRELALAHHGSLELIETNGEGATFCLALPIKD